MAAFNFPNSPSTNDLHTENNVTWKWNGTVWKRQHNSYLTASTLNITGISTFGGYVYIPEYLIHQGDGNTWFRFPSDDTITLGTSGSTRVIIDSGGRIGIKNTSPSSQYFNNLVVGDNSSGDWGITIRTNSSNKGVLAFSDTDSADANRYDGYIAYHHNGQSMRFHTGGANERLRIDSSGRLLIGTTTEGYASADDLTVATTGNTGITIRSSTGGLGTLAFSDGTTGAAEYDGYIQYSQADQYMDFGGAGGNIRLRITSAGSVGINSTSPDRRFTLHQDATCRMNLKSLANSTAGIEFGDEADHNAGYIVYDNTDNSFQVGVNGTGEKLRITSGGALLLGATSTSNVENFRIHTANSNKAIIKFTNSGTGTAASDGFEMGLNGNEHVEFWHKENHPMYFATNNVERLRITAAGTAEFYGGEGGTDAIKVQSEGGGVGLYFSNFQGITDTGDSTRLGVGKNDNALIWMNASGSQVGCLAYGTTDAVPLVFSTANTERLRITAAGNVGIGTNNVDSPLEVVGTGPSLVTIHHGDGSTNDEARLMLGALPNNPPDNRGAGIAAVNNGAGHDLTIKTSSSHAAGPTEKVRITSAGDMGLGVTDATILNDAGFRELTIGGLAEGAAIHLQDVDGNVKFGIFTSDVTAAAIIRTITNHPLHFRTNNTERLRIEANGHLTLGGGKIYGEDNASNVFTLQSTSGNNNHSRIEIGASQSSDNGGVHFYTAGTSVATRRMTLKGTSGYLGLGVDNPVSLIHTGAGNVGIARTINNHQTSNTGSIWDLSINRESFAYPGAGTAAGGLNQSLNVDNQYAVSTFRSTQQNYNGTNQWYDVAHFNAWDFTGKIVIQSGGTFTGDEIVIDIVSSYNSALGNGRSGPYMEVRRTEGHNGGRFTKVRVGCHNSSRSDVYVQVYYSGNATHNANSWITSTVFDYGSGYGCAQKRGVARWQAASTLNETWKELDIDGSNQNYWNTSTTPAFMAYKYNNSGQISSGTYVYNSQVNERGGDNYSTSTGRFTAPCDGYYYVHANVQLYGSGTSGKHCEFYKNGADIFSGGTSAPWYDEPAGSHHNIYMFGVFSLATDDYLHVWRNGDSRGMQSAFCGFLIR